MSHSTSGTVECPLCGETFDPSAAGGWCTNSDCGEWQYEDAAETVEDDDRDRDAVVDDDRDRDAVVDDAGDSSSTVSAADPEPGSGAEEPDDSSAEAVDESTASEPVDADPDAASDAAGAAADSADEQSADEQSADEQPADEQSADEQPADEQPADEQLADEHAAKNEDAAETEDEVGGHDAGVDLTCPACGGSVDPDDNFCASCGEDVEALEPGPLTECPSCEASVEPEHNFCTNCGEDLSQYRPGGDDAESAGDAAAGAGADDGADADSSDVDGAEPAEAAGSGSGVDRADRSVTETAPVDESLTLMVRNHEIEVWDGDVVGREVRNVIMETGGDEEDAVRVHREHVQFEYEDGGFHLVALGQNPTVVNGERVEQGERVPVSPGDRIDLSNVAKMRVEES